MPDLWYYHDGSKVHGPFSPRQFATLAASGSLRPDHRVRKGSNGKWYLARQVKGLSFPSLVQADAVATPSANASPPPLTPHRQPAPHPVVERPEPAVTAPVGSAAVVAPVAAHGVPVSGLVGQAVPYLQRLMRGIAEKVAPYLSRPLFIVAACCLAALAVVAIGLELIGPPRPIIQNPKPDIAHSENLHNETVVAGSGTRPTKQSVKDCLQTKRTTLTWPSAASARPFVATHNLPRHTSTGDESTARRLSSRRPSPITRKPSNSNRTTVRLTHGEVVPTGTGATATRPLPIAMKRSASTQSWPWRFATEALPICAAQLQEGHRRLQ